LLAGRTYSLEVRNRPLAHTLEEKEKGGGEEEEGIYVEIDEAENDE
jgi:hypothetical protein